MCSARRWGRSAAAPPAEMQRAAAVARADPTSQVQPTCSPSRLKTCRGSQTFNPHHSNLVSGFRQTARCVALVIRNVAL